MTADVCRPVTTNHTGVTLVIARPHDVVPPRSESEKPAISDWLMSNADPEGRRYNKYPLPFHRLRRWKGRGGHLWGHACLPSYSSLRDDECSGHLRLPHKANRRWQATSLRFVVALRMWAGNRKGCPYNPNMVVSTTLCCSTQPTCCNL